MNEREMTKEIANAFGVLQDSLELVLDDEHPDKPERCQSCAGWAKKYAELEAALSARNESNRITYHSPWESQDFCV